jgi:hypothetical protein
MSYGKALNRFPLLFGGLLFAATTPSGAQQLPRLVVDSLQIGTRLRVRTETGRLFQGILRGRDQDALTIKPDFDIVLGRAPDTTWTFARDQLAAGWANTGTRWKRGATLGLIIGAAAGAVAGLALGMYPEDPVPERAAPLGAVVVGLAGGAIGAAIGAHVRVWTPLEF